MAWFLSVLLLFGAFPNMPLRVLAEDSSEITNIALYGTAYADSSYWPITNLNDGNETTLWIAGSSSVPVSAGIKLDHTYEVRRLRVVFEHRNTTDQILKFYAEYLDSTTKEYVKFWESQNYNEAADSFYAEISPDTPIKTSNIRITITERQNTAAWPAIEEIEIFAEDPYTHTERTNVALNKPVEVSAGTGASAINDGSKNNYWDGGVAPAEFEIDLESGYFLSEFVAFPYFGDGRYYNYEIWTSLDGRNYVKVAEKTNTAAATSMGDTYEMDEPVNARYIRVIMTKNSANPSVHMKEFEAYGVIDPDYKEEDLPDTDLKDPDNIAFGKHARSNLSADKTDNVTDGSDFTYWVGEFYPSYVDVDLMEEYDLSEIILNFPVREGRYYYYTVYGSNDCSNYDRLYQKRTDTAASDDGDLIDVSGKTYRFIRIYIEYCSDAGSARLSEVRVHGTPTDQNTETLRTGSVEEILGISPWSETAYADPITEEETIENIYGIIDRTVGAEYRSWFTFEIAQNQENSNDYYEITDNGDGRIRITGNDGISLASGLNYYYKNYCNVNISEQANQTKMPDSVKAVGQTVRKETPYAIRYAFNYCTLDYTFAFFGEEDFQKEYDWLALNGVNVVLDLAGQEAVWIKFLMNFGYSFDEAKDWIAGPSYYAWQFMDNMEIFGGPVSDGWITDRLEMARKNQRWKNSLGMQTVLQGYAGMIPTNFSEYQDVDILKQGGWCGLNRPDMIRTDGTLYDEYAALFYQEQEWAFGATSDYYAVDPFHEGGIRPSDLTDDTIAAEVLDSLLRYDEDAVWMVQAWWSNPTNALLKGMGQYRQDHVIILDLTGLEAPKWNTTSYGSTTLDDVEFNGTDWVWCMLENYGGNPSMDGQLKKIASDIPNACKNSSHMKGIGIISEATFDNPVIYDLIFDMAWETEEIDLDEWLDRYVIRRYGAESENAREAWNLLKKTIYNRSGNTAYTLARLPENVGAQSLPYNAQTVEKAFKLLLKDFNKLSASEGYRYDLTELMRQLVNNYGVVQYQKVLEAYTAKDLTAFRAEKEKFLNAFDVCDLIQGTQKEQLVGEWIGKAEDWAEKYDDFSYDSLTMNAKALITTWAGAASASALPDYAYRNYQGMMTDLYKARWQTFLDKEEAYLQDGTEIKRLNQSDYFHFYWDWVMNTPEYTREADNSPKHMLEVANRLLAECSVIEVIPENEGNIAMDAKIWASREVNSGGSGGGYASYANDGSIDTYWDGGDWAERPWVIIDLGSSYTLEKVNIVNYYSGSRYYNYEIYTSPDGEAWTPAAEKTSRSAATRSGDTFTLPNSAARYIKVVGTYNSANEGFHLKEVRAYGKPETIVHAGLTQMLGLLEGLDISEYTPESREALTASIEAAKAINNDPNATQEEQDAALKALLEAFQNLEYAVQKLHLETALTAAQNLLALAKNYEEDAVSLAKAAADGQLILADENATQEAVDQAAYAVLDELAKLAKKADISSLESLIEAALDLLNETYTQDSRVSLKTAIEKGTEVIENQNRQENDIANAYAEIIDAIIHLQRRGNKAALKAMIEKAGAILANESLYTETTLAGLAEALAEANVVYEDPDALQTTIDSTVIALTNKTAAVRQKGDVNGDGIVTAGDCAVLLKYTAEMEELPPAAAECADVNSDGTADTQDAALILQYAAEAISAF